MGDWRPIGAGFMEEMRRSGGGGPAEGIERVKQKMKTEKSKY